MASGSSSGSIPPPITRACTYHVFLSFRGEDTGGRFTSHLYDALNRKGITTYRDDNKLRKGDVISDELLKAIEESMFAVIVFSPDYASSSWCLDELQKILECSNKLGQHIVPVFYGVEPSDVRHQRGTFEEAFKKHEQRHDSEKVKRWRHALTQVANLSGWTSKIQDKAVLVENIAQHIFEMLIPKLPSSVKNLVGINSRVEQVITLIGLGLNDVRYIGIWGMGGMGKTTIARAVFETIRRRFEVTCFLAGVRENCEKKDITHVQKQLLDQMNISSNAVHNKYDGRIIIQNSLRLKKVLLVLDDVNHEKQLEDLAGEQDWFGPGSRIIITTRDVEVLKGPEVRETYKVEGLVESEALNFFCLKAFKQQEPTEGFLDLSKEVVKYSGGLPLALKVLGSYLNGRPIAVWYSAIERIKKSLQSEMIDVLKISYDGLDDMEKNIFLDIACFFKGYEKGDVTRLLEGCGYQTQLGLDILINRSLVTINKYDQLEMHDMVEEMGKQIVIQESPKDTSKRSRLWCYKDINLVLTRNNGTEAIQGIGLSPGYACYEACWSPEAFSKTNQLQFLSLYGVELPCGLSCLPSSLKVLHWRSYPLKTLPLVDQHQLVEIKLLYSKIEHIWYGVKSLEKLRYLDLSHSWYLKQTPDLSGVPILETLVLEDCSDLIEVHPSLKNHKTLVLLNLSRCISLKTLPGKLEMSSLKELILKDCLSFTNLPEFGECMEQLSRLSLEGTSIRNLPTSVGCLVGLQDLSLDRCNQLVCLPNTIHGLKSLKTLKASECPDLCKLMCKEELCAIDLKLPYCVSRLHFLSSLDLSYCGLTEESFPYNLLYLPLLIDLNLDGNYFVSIPTSIQVLSKLRCLRINNCRKLQHLPRLSPSMRDLEAYDCDSLNELKSNPLSKAYTSSVFASPSQDHGEVLQMLISGSEIPSWFVHQEDGNAVSVSAPYDCPLDERLGIALCFQLQISGGGCGSPDYYYRPRWSLRFRNGQRSITKRISPKEKPCSHLYILYLTNKYLGDEFHQHDVFELVVEDSYFIEVQILRSATRWVKDQDIKDWNTSENIEQVLRHLKLI